MNPQPCIQYPATPRLRGFASACLWLGLAVAASAQAPTTGTINGRVFSATGGSYVHNAVVSVEGTSLQTMTDDLGEFTLTAIPAGTVQLKVGYTGASPVVEAVTVPAGQIVRHD